MIPVFPLGDYKVAEAVAPLTKRPGEAVSSEGDSESASGSVSASGTQPADLHTCTPAT